MAKSTYLQLCNRILRETNEVTLSTVTGNRGLQAYVADLVNLAIFDINSREPEWPFNKQSGSQALTAGVAEYSLPSGFSSLDYESFFLRPTNIVTNGTFDSSITGWTDISTGTGTATAASARMRLNGGASGVGQATQAVSTFADLPTKIRFQVFTGTLTLKIGTTSGGTEILTDSYEVDNVGVGTYHVVSFTPTSTTTYVTFSNSANANYDVDNVQVILDIEPVRLKQMQLDEWRYRERQLDLFSDRTVLAIPERVIISQADSFILTPGPKYDNLTVTFDYWAAGTQLANDSDTCAIPERYEKAITQYGCSHVHDFKSDAARASYYEKKYNMTIQEMRRDLINKNDYMRAV
jgi:hypothetical protein